MLYVFLDVIFNVYVGSVFFWFLGFIVDEKEYEEKSFWCYLVEIFYFRFKDVKRYFYVYLVRIDYLSLRVF